MITDLDIDRLTKAHHVLIYTIIYDFLDQYIDPVIMR